MKAVEVVNSLDDPSNKSIICETVNESISKNVDESKDSFEHVAEKMAFQNTFLKDDGTFCDDHLLLNGITDYDKLFCYYEKRSREVSHPLLKIVYLGMVFEFKKKYTRQEMNFDLKKEYILSICKYIDEEYLPYKCAEPRWVIRAIDLAIRTQNQELIDRVKLTTIRYVDDVNEGTLLAIVLDKITENRKYFESEITHILEKTETLLKSLSERSGLEFLPTQALTKSLCKYYNSQNNRIKLKETIDNFSHFCHEKWIGSSSYGFREVAELYKKYGLTDDLKREEFQLQQFQAKEFQELPWWPFDMSVTIDEHYEEQEEKSWEDNLDYILDSIVPDYNNVENDLKSRAKFTPLTMMCQKITQAPDLTGRNEGYVGSIIDDPEGNIMSKFFDQISFNYSSLKTIIDLFKSKISKEELLHYLQNSYAFSKIDSRFLGAIIDYYFENNFLVFIHLIIPQIEEAFRNTLPPNGRTTYKKIEDHTERLKILNDIFDEDEDLITSIFGENLVKFFRVILIDRRFLNIRNAVCHGYFSYDRFNEQNFDLLMLIALCVAKHTKTSS